MKEQESNRIVRGLIFIISSALPGILSAQMQVPQGRCDTSIKHTFVSSVEYKQIIGKAVLILPLDTHAVSASGKKRYKSPEPIFYKMQDFGTKVNTPVSGSAGTITDVRLVRKKGMQYMVYTLALRSDTLYYKHEFYGNKKNDLITPFLILDYAQCVKQKYLDRKVLCTKDTLFQSFGSQAQIQVSKGETWTITDYEIVSPSAKGCIFCFWEPALILENKKGQKITVNTPDYYMPVVNFNFGTLGNFATSFKIED